MKKRPVCIGAGLVALDVILNGSPLTPPKISAGGSCGNVLSILAFLGWDSFPIARLAKDQASHELLRDLSRWNIHTDHLTIDRDGSTPIIIHRILKDKNGQPVHRFEFRDPETHNWLPRFKAITKNVANEVIESKPTPELFYFDRMNPGTYELAKYLKSKGTIIFFEPSSVKDEKQFEKFLVISDIIKFSEDRIPDYKTRFKSSKCILEIETLGKNGLNYRFKNHSRPENWHLLKGLQIDKIQDAAGAGDWCSSGILYSLFFQGCSNFGLTTSDQLENALSYGQALGALNCKFDGARGLMYHYNAEELKDITVKFLEFGTTQNINLLDTPKIDISSSLKFSDLYEAL